MTAWLKVLPIGLVLLAFAASAQVGQIITFPAAGVGTPGAGCAADTTLQARMDGGQNAAAVTALVCGLVTDGVWSTKLDALYVLATNSTANANLNWISTSFGLTVGHATVTLTANSGYAGDGSAGWLQTSFNPATATTPKFTQNANSFGVCIVNSRSVANTSGVWGANQAGSQWAAVQPLFTGNVLRVGNATATIVTQAATNVQGGVISNRDSSTTTQLYLNGALSASPASTSTTIVNQNFYIAAIDAGGSAFNFSADTVAYVFWGGNLSSTNVTNIYNRLHTYLQTVGEVAAC